MSDSQPSIQAEAAPRLSLVIPAYNEARRIAATLDAASAALADLGVTGEIIVADDGSSDDTATIVQSLSQTNSAVRLLRLPHRGKAAAVRSGMLASEGEFILFSDADLAVPLSYIRPFLELAGDGADVVIASREGATASRIGEPEYRHIMGRVFNRLVQVLLLPGIEDSQCGFKLFRRNAATQILHRTQLYRESDTEVTGARVTAFDVELLVIARRLGMRTVVVPVEWTYGEQSKVNPVRDSLLNLRDLAMVKVHDLRRKYR